MPVNLVAPDPSSLHAVPGVEIGVAMAGVRKANRRDLVVSRWPKAPAWPACSRSNRFCAAPVQVCREHLAAGAGHPRHAGQHRQRQRRHRRRRPGARAPHLRRAGRAAWASQPEQVLPFSTGVIMETLPVERIEAGLPAALADAARRRTGPRPPQGIMTTDTLPKAASRQVQIGGRTVTVTGIAKGAGMIRPNMATMLGFVATDAAIAPALLQALVREAADAQLQPHHHRRRHLDQRFLRADRHAPGRPCADHRSWTRPTAARCATR